MRKLSMLAFAVVWMFSAAWAQNANIQGRVTDPSGSAVPGVTVTASSAHAKASAVTGADGRFQLSFPAVAGVTVKAVKSGFAVASRGPLQLQSGQMVRLNLVLAVPRLVQSVAVSARAPRTSVTSVTLSAGQILAVAGPIGGSAQALTAAPGVNIYGYGGIASTARSEIVVRGIKTGWSSVNGDIEKNGIMFLLDGIPMNNMIAANGHFEPTELPIMPLISHVHVTYGPGDPSNRWFDSMGGTVNYVPVQPARELGFSFATGASYGSYGTKSTYLILHTGFWRGWSAVASGGITANDTFRTQGWNAPAQGWAGYGKVRKQLANGSFSIGYYMGHNYDYRPNFLPVTPINQNGQAITTQGLRGPNPNVPANAPLYSQATTGFYSSLDGSYWFKLVRVNSALVYSRLQLGLSRHLLFRQKLWYRHGYRLHYRVNNYFGPGSPNTEWYYPTTDTLGDQSSILWDGWKHNEVSAGGYLMHGLYNTPVAIYNPAMGTSKTDPFGFNADDLTTDYGVAYLQDRISLLPNLFLTPGISEQLFDTHFYNVGRGAFPAASANAIQFSTTQDSFKKFARFSPSVSLAYLPFSWLGLHGNYAESYQNPVDRAFGADAGTNSVDLAQLLPVKSRDAEGGVRLNLCDGSWLGKCSVDTTYFHDELSDETMEVTNSELTNPLTEFAFGSAVYNGVALSFNDIPSWHVQLHGNATFQHDYFLHYSPQGSTLDYAGYPISDSPNLTANLGLSTYFSAGGWGLFAPQLWWQYVGARDLFSNYINAPTRQAMPGYGLVNLTLSASLSRLGGAFAHSPLQLSFGIYNLFNKQYNPTAYITSGGYFNTSFGNYVLVDPGAPREYAISIRYGF